MNLEKGIPIFFNARIGSSTMRGRCWGNKTLRYRLAMFLVRLGARLLPEPESRYEVTIGGSQAGKGPSETPQPSLVKGRGKID